MQKLIIIAALLTSTSAVAAPETWTCYLRTTHAPIVFTFDVKKGIELKGVELDAKGIVGRSIFGPCRDPNKSCQPGFNGRATWIAEEGSPETFYIYDDGRFWVSLALHFEGRCRAF